MERIRMIATTGVLAFSFTTNISPAQDQSILIGWNDLGMHCANKTFGNPAVLPPFNNGLASTFAEEAGNRSGSPRATGDYRIPFKGDELPSGKNSCRLIVDGRVASRAMTVVR